MAVSPLRCIHLPWLRGAEESAAQMERSYLNLSGSSGFPFSGLMPYPSFPSRFPLHTFPFRCFDGVSLKLGLLGNDLSVSAKCKESWGG